ncbi:cyclase family protein [Gloeophyllum trabeum ATCC 11539]|uniref:Cyclase family protein n=1 Tax=Gloeophyllum trabeum (strain ATCC 11539 / FP-39264 / Madison 617) TaxID=670483 RepID=S7Q736_GLOTA|nr:cyclase family protein [Gloeophyllum trabeum ATCC 11539]EPQ55332.1 cyclase family protein [Gloeophyllum trabeum ATCC 11539]
MIDLTHPLDATAPVCAGHPSFACHPLLLLERDGINVCSLTLGSHTGTHIDAPYHFVENGKEPRSKLAWPDVEPYAQRLGPGVIVLLHTGWSKYWGQPQYRDHPSLDVDCARKIMASGVRVVGVDALSPDELPLEGEKDCFDVHYVILGAGGVIAENLNNLDNINFDDVMVSLLPLRLTGCDGSPIRAVAWPASSRK